MMPIEAIDHIGVRITDPARALAFYAVLGFEPIVAVEFDAVLILKNSAGVEINLIVNGVDLHGGKNILMDMPDKHPGITHVAFKVADMQQAIAQLGAHQIAITQGPVSFGDGHVSVFVRDPDRNTIELRARLTQASAAQIEGLSFYDPKG